MWIKRWISVNLGLLVCVAGIADAASNNPPVAANSQTLAVKNTPRDIKLSATDADGDSLTFIPAVTSSAGGVIAVKRGNVVTYTPKTDYIGVDSFTFKVRDSNKAFSNIATVRITNVKAKNAPPVANAGADQTVKPQAVVTLNALSSKDSDGNVVGYLWKQTVGQTVSLAARKTAKPTFTAPDVTTETALTFELTVKDNNNAVSKDTVTVSVLPQTVGGTGKLNDTGITTCSNSSQNAQPCPLLDYPGQDGDSGRDVTANDDSDGHAGFSFTKISSTGAELPASATEWSCVKDNVTGLMWEVKTDDGGLHDKDWTYSWYEPDGTKNGGFAGYQSNGSSCGGTRQCDTYSYVQAVNAAGWCGAQDWRMPTRRELQSIVSSDRFRPAIDTAWFPNTRSNQYWSSSPIANSDSYYVWSIDFYHGNSGWWSLKGSYNSSVRLVRGSQ